MSYLNHAHDPRRRATAVITVGAVHVVLAVGLVTGLTVDFTRIADPPPLRATDIPLDPPKPDPSPTPSTPVEQVSHVQPPPVPKVVVSDTAPVERVEVDDAETYVSRVPETPRVEVAVGPPPRPAFAPKRAAARNGNWITNDDYPRRALVENAEGSVNYLLVIGTNGKVSSCELTSTTGNRALDAATCRLIESRARFEAATDETGAKVLGTFRGSVTWDIPD